MPENNIPEPARRNRGGRLLRLGFSTGAAAAAAARAALRLLLTGLAPRVVSLRLPAGFYLPVMINEIGQDGPFATAAVVKDGGDDPDITHLAHIEARVRLWRLSLPHPIPEDQKRDHERPGARGAVPDDLRPGIHLIGGEGVGVVTRPGLAVRVGEPAINPGPREMLVQNIEEEILWCSTPNDEGEGAGQLPVQLPGPSFESLGPSGVFLPFGGPRAELDGLRVEVEIRAPEGAVLARRTLNPRLGIVGGISILGVTGLVKPFSHEAYEETIDAALSVAGAAGCEEIVLSTGGKSEHFARGVLPGLPLEAFVQIADFFGFGVRKCRERRFKRVVHSAFFGKVVKMAQGHAYTHARDVPLDLAPLARLASEARGYDEDFRRTLAASNTARHALEFLLASGASDVIEAAARQALEQSARMAGGELELRLLLFDYDGALLADLTRDR